MASSYDASGLSIESVRWRVLKFRTPPCFLLPSSQEVSISGNDEGMLHDETGNKVYPMPRNAA